jgi:hypothetical protein
MQHLNATPQKQGPPEVCGGCKICSIFANRKAATPSPGGEDEVRGGGLLAWSVAAFVLPVVAAVAGALLAGEGEGRRFVGLAIGLAAGMLLAAAAWRMARHKRPCNKELP